MVKQGFRRLPKHIGVIPDGNRRWAVCKGLEKESGYQYGLEPGLMLYELCLEFGIPELTFYGFTQDNTKRPSIQREAFRKACVDAVNLLSNRDASLLVVGDTSSPMFPEELLPYTKKCVFGKDLVRVNFLVNYGWKWDLNNALNRDKMLVNGNIIDYIASKDISRIDLIMRWGDRRRLSGFLPIQSIYSDIYVVNSLWPDFKREHFVEGLRWYETQDVTLGG